MFDGAVTTLEEQALLPLLNPHEMDMTAHDVETRLANDTMYVRLFQGAFGSGPITIHRVALALATYQRTLVSHRAPYDRWVAGDSTALSESARRGAALFMGEKGGCARCHIPPLFTDGQFHDIGLDSLPADSGRARVTKNRLDFGKFKTPTLRNIFHTGPYMHDGRLVSLEHVVMHYNTGIKASGRVDAGLKLLELEEGEIFDLVAFLESLTDDVLLQSPQP
jgi:cytochrome c peroxidase